MEWNGPGYISYYGLLYFRSLSGRGTPNGSHRTVSGGHIYASYDSVYDALSFTIHPSPRP